MFSYRHAFHAGNHADVLKHLVLIHCIQYLQEKDGALLFVDTHAGAGMYSLREGYALTSQESLAGIDRLWSEKDREGANPLLKSYWELIAKLNPSGSVNYYPGSPFIFANLLRPQDRLCLFELHPTDITILQENVSRLRLNQQIQVRKQDGFKDLKSLLPPTSRRGLVLIDPSYELKADYQTLETCLKEALQRFATGTYLIWYPDLQRPESKQLPKRLKLICEEYQRPWLRAELRVANQPTERRLQASGIWVINPVWYLKPYLERLLPLLTNVLSQDQHSQYLIETSNQT